MKATTLNKQSGFSLVELMISLILGIFITGGMLQLFVNSNQSYRVQENISRLQENGRFAMDFISKDIRAADYWGCMNNTTFIENNLNLGSVYDNFGNAIVGTNNSGLNNSDTITVAGAASSGVYVVATPATTSANLKVTPNSPLRENDIVIVSDCTAGDIFQVTNDPTTGGAGNKDELTHNTGAVSAGPGNLDQPLQKIYDTNAQVYKLKSIAYTIAAGANGEAALFRSSNGAATEELVEGINDMQILYGVDTNGDNSPNYYAASNTLTSAQMNQVKSVRISLLAITQEDNLATEPLPYSILGVTTTPTDRKIRRVYTTTIAIRNRLL